MAGSRRAMLCAGLVALLAWAHPAAAATPRACDQVLLPAADGARLHGWVNHEAPAAPRPVLLTISSYENDHCPGPSSYTVGGDVANRMTMVFMSMRGSGSSEGTYDLLGPQTADDIHRIVRWAATQPWSDGRIVLAGASGNALFMIHALTEPAVIAAVAQTSCADMFRCLHRGGAAGLQIGGVYLANMLQGYATGVQLRGQDATATNPTPPQQLAGMGAAMALALTHPVYDDYWAQRSLLARLPGLGKPVLYTTSDFDLLDVFDNWASAPNAWVNLGVSHSVWWDFALGQAPPRYRDVILGQIDRFVSHFALGDGPAPARVALMTADGGFPAWLDQHAYLRTADRWPLPGTRFTRVALTAGASLTDGAGSGSDTSPLVSSPGVGADLRTAMLGPVLARADGGVAADPSAVFDLRREEAAGLTYTSPPLRRALELTGPVLARLWATTTASDLTWAVRLTDVFPDGQSQWITDGYLRAQMRRVDDARSERAGGDVIRVWRDYDALQPVPLAEPVAYDVQLGDVSAIFRPGHRLRFDVLPIAGAGYDTGDAPSAGAITLLHDAAHPSSVLLPVIPHRCQEDVAMTDGMQPAPECATSYVDALNGGPSQ